MWHTNVHIRTVWGHKGIHIHGTCFTAWPSVWFQMGGRSSHAELSVLCIMHDYVTYSLLCLLIIIGNLKPFPTRLTKLIDTFGYFYDHTPRHVRATRLHAEIRIIILEIRIISSMQGSRTCHLLCRDRLDQSVSSLRMSHLQKVCCSHVDRWGGAPTWKMENIFTIKIYCKQVYIDVSKKSIQKVRLKLKDRKVPRLAIYEVSRRRIKIFNPRRLKNCKHSKNMPGHILYMCWCVNYTHRNICVGH